MKKKLVHLSHNDLDGYGCQFITKQLMYDDRFYFNTNYGEESTVQLNKAIEKAIELDGDDVTLMVTDFSLSIEQCDTLLKLESETTIDVKVFDHHPVSQSVLDKYKFYHLDTSMSATLLVATTYGDSINDYTMDMAEIISAYDIFNKEDIEVFELGSYLNYEISRIVSDLDYKKSYTGKFIIDLLEVISEHEMFDTQHQALFEFSFPELKRLALKMKGSYTKTVYTTLQDIVFEDTKSENGIYRDELYNVLVIENLPFRSVMSERLLKEFTMLDFIMIVNPIKNSVSMRSFGDRVDVNELARSWGIGGGHKLAAGGRFKVSEGDTYIDEMKKVGFELTALTLEDLK